MRAVLADLLAHSAWANAEFLSAWLASPCRDHEELRRRLHHVLVVQNGFVALLRADPFDGAPPTTPPSSAELADAVSASHDELLALVSSLDESALARTVTVPWFTNPPCVITAGQALHQVVLHTHHHRGQLMTRLKDLGGEPRDVDYIIWLWQGRPTTRWPSLAG